MISFITFKCCNCNSVIFNLPKQEASKLVDLEFLCDYCNKPLEIKNFKIAKIIKESLCTL